MSILQLCTFFCVFFGTLVFGEGGCPEAAELGCFDEAYGCGSCCNNLAVPVGYGFATFGICVQHIWG